MSNQILPEAGRSSDLQDSEMMAHLLNALEDRKDIGDYGRLVFLLVARHFMEEDEIVELLSGQPDIGADEARGMYHQVSAKDYNPPRRARIIEWQQYQDFPICPNPEDPNACNVYQDLQFPDYIYERINEYWTEIVEAQ